MTDYHSYQSRYTEEDKELAERIYRDSEWFQQNKDKEELVTNPDGGISAGVWSREPCCNRPARNMNGWCVNCNDPCI